ncbi:hypothetical protein ACHAXS_013335, partial [Conticribra weissflogii]
MPTIKGTASVTDNHAQLKLLRSTTFPSNFSQKVDFAKIHRGVIQHWIEERITAILGFEDDIVGSTAVHLFLPEVAPSPSEGGEAGGAVASGGSAAAEIDPRRAQLDLAGFLGEKEAAEFASELWTMMLDAQTAPAGVPRKLVEKKKEEMRRQRELQQQQQQQQHQNRQRFGQVQGHVYRDGGYD